VASLCAAMAALLNDLGIITRIEFERHERGRATRTLEV
jgi:hypothetical protein